ncbi:CIC11C00000000152 [Sungouiella intermedia]|uniref:CIC11C00000000152 n=1 Tax=Sungouiella intermedia TaxID=45354 RepID=A0A1L0BEL6_9ASCO|nr:CIC11C00000000152 [[Candida] intermedia]
MFELEVNSSASTMSNYSVYFLLQNNGLDLNCSVYSLTLGLLIYTDYYYQARLGNVTEFLPAYYATNCSIDELANQIKNQNLSAIDVLEWVDEFQRNPYNVADNGDSFVALLFTILALCVSCWMLMLMFLLLPKHKRKPVLTLLATLFYLVVLTAILSKITEVARDEYYADSLDMIKILGIVNERKAYSVSLIVSYFLTNLAILQQVVKLTAPRWKRANAYLGAALVVVFLVLSALEKSQVSDYFTYVYTERTVTFTAKSSFRLVILVWWCVALAYHTIWGTASSPFQVSYSKKLMPLVVLTLVMMMVHFVLSLLVVTEWRDQWLITSWITFIPHLLDMFLLTCSWEWYYSIRDLELKLELVGMLGRPISLDDVMGFSNTSPTKRASIRGRFQSFLDFFLIRSHQDPEPYTKDIPSTTTYSNSTALETPSPATQLASQDEEIDLGERIPMTELAIESVGNKTLHQTDNVHEITGRNNEGVDGNHDNDDDDDDEDDDYSYEVEYIDNDDMWNEDSDHIYANTTDTAGIPGVGHSGNAGISGSQVHNSDSSLAGQGELPSFRAHPGFHADDYWDDK